MTKYPNNFKLPHFQSYGRQPRLCRLNITSSLHIIIWLTSLFPYIVWIFIPIPHANCFFFVIYLDMQNGNPRSYLNIWSISQWIHVHKCWYHNTLVNFIKPIHDYRAVVIIYVKYWSLSLTCVIGDFIMDVLCATLIFEVYPVRMCVDCLDPFHIFYSPCHKNIAMSGKQCYFYDRLANQMLYRTKYETHFSSVSILQKPLIGLVWNSVEALRFRIS